MAYKMLSVSIILIGGTAFVLAGLIQFAHVAQQSRWASSKGELLRSELRNSSQNGQVTYFVAVEYAFVAGEQKCIGDSVSTDYIASSDRTRHAQLKEELDSSRQLTVWYAPSNPTSCVLIRSTGVRAKLPIFFGLILLSSLPAVYCFLSTLQEANKSNLDRLLLSIRENEGMPSARSDK